FFALLSSFLRPFFSLFFLWCSGDLRWFSFFLGVARRNNRHSEMLRLRLRMTREKCSSFCYFALFAVISRLLVALLPLYVLRSPDSFGIVFSHGLQLIFRRGGRFVNIQRDAQRPARLLLDLFDRNPRMIGS